MKTNDLIIIAENAAMSFAVLAVITCLVWSLNPTPVNATGEANASLKEASDTVSTGGATVTGAVEKDATDKGKVNAVVNLHNPTSKPVSVQLQADVSKFTVLANMSRVGLPPKLELSKLRVVELKPGQLKKLMVAKGVKVKAGEQAKLKVTVDKKRTTVSTAGTRMKAK